MGVKDDDHGEGLVHEQKQEDQREYVACLKCTHNCFSSPRHSSVPPPVGASASLHDQLSPTAPSFLKVMDDPCSCCLEIPQAFGSTCLSRCMGEAKLEGPSGWVWYAPFIWGTSLNLGEVVLGSPGWDDFAHDHKLQRGDLLVLTYFSSSQLFKVRIFDVTEGIEKSQHCLPSKPHYVSMAQHAINQRNTSTMNLQVYDSKSRGFSDTHMTDAKGHFTKQSLQVICGHRSLFEVPKIGSNRPHGITENGSHEINMVRCCHGNIKHYMERNNGCSGEMEEPENHLDRSRSKIKSLIRENEKAMTTEIVSLGVRNDNQNKLNHSKALVPFMQGSEQLCDEEELISRHKTSSKHSRKRRKRQTVMYNPYAIASPAEKERVEKEARGFHSENPFVIKSITASSVYKDRKLVWPKAFCDAYMPKRNAMMTWVDGSGKEWRCLWLARRNYSKGISFISAGWAPFVNAHRLIEHDVCVFELIKQEILHFRVHVFKQKTCERGCYSY